MRAYQEQYRAPLPRIKFGGLDTKHSELFVPGDYATSMNNIDLKLAGGARKRDGMYLIMADETTSNAVPGPGDVYRLVMLHSPDKSFLVAARGSKLYLGDASSYTTPWAELTDCPLTTGGTGTPAIAPFTIETDAGDPTTWEYCGACAFMVNGVDEPVIVYGDEHSSALGCVWPEGVYSDTAMVRGYPERWADHDGYGNADWPKHLYYGGDTKGGGPDNAQASRMYAWGFSSDPDRVDYSALGVPYNFLHSDPIADPVDVPEVDGGFFFCMRGDGDQVIGVRQLADLTVVFKRSRTVLYHGGVGSGFEQVGILPVGAVSNDGIVSAGNDIYFWSEGGPRVLSGVIKYGALNQESIGGNILDDIYAVSSDSLPLVRARYETAWNRIIWYVGTEGTPSVDTCLVYYPESGDTGGLSAPGTPGRWARWSGYYGEIVHDCIGRPLGSPRENAYGLDSDGNLFLLNVSASDGVMPVYDEVEETWSFVERNIEAMYMTPWMDLSVISIDKRLLELIVAYGEEGRGGVVIEYAMDYSSDFYGVGSATRTYDGESGATGIWDYCSWDDFDWDVTSRSLVRYAMQDLGFLFRIKITDDSELPFSIDGMALDVAFKGKV